MKYVKILGLLAVAATALMAFAASAGATTITTGGTVAASTIEATNESNLTLTSSGLSVTCEHSGVAGTIDKESGGTGKTVTGAIGTLTFSKCSQHVNVKANGTLEAHWTSGSNGTLTGSGSTVEIDYTTIFGTVHCNYLTNNTHLGTITGATEHGNNKKATLDINAAAIPIEAAGSNGLCGSTASWSGSYVINTPVGATVDQN